MVKNIKKLDDSKVHWFWNLTTRWWFFPMFVYLLSFLYAIIFENYEIFYYGIDIPWIVYYTFGTFLFLTAGIAYFVLLIIQLIVNGNIGFLVILSIPIQAIFCVYVVASVFKIVRYKNEENKILKKQIKILFLLISLSFIGLVLQVYYPINASFAP